MTRWSATAFTTFVLFVLAATAHAQAPSTHYVLVRAVMA